jgi:hypothetical protein
MTALRLSCAVLLAVCGILQTGARASIVIPLSLSNVTTIPADNGAFGTVALDSVTVGTVAGVKVTVTSEVPGYFIDKLYFNSTIPSGTLRLVDSSLVDSTPALNTTAGNRNASEFGKFDFLFDTKDPANFALTTYSFTVVATSGNVDVSSLPTDFIAPSSNPNGGQAFAAHIKTTNNSGFVAIDIGGVPPIPEPASLGFLGCGTAALLLRRRRRVADV